LAGDGGRRLRRRERFEQRRLRFRRRLYSVVTGRGLRRLEVLNSVPNRRREMVGLILAAAREAGV
jgi:hypothetical protein